MAMKTAVTVAACLLFGTLAVTLDPYTFDVNVAWPLAALLFLYVATKR